MIEQLSRIFETQGCISSVLENVRMRWGGGAGEEKRGREGERKREGGIERMKKGK